MKWFQCIVPDVPWLVATSFHTVPQVLRNQTHLFHTLGHFGLSGPFSNFKIEKKGEGHIFQLSFICTLKAIKVIKEDEKRKKKRLVDWTKGFKHSECFIASSLFCPDEQVQHQASSPLWRLLHATHRRTQSSWARDDPPAGRTQQPSAYCFWRCLWGSSHPAAAMLICKILWRTILLQKKKLTCGFIFANFANYSSICLRKKLLSMSNRVNLILSFRLVGY